MHPFAPQNICAMDRSYNAKREWYIRNREQVQARRRRSLLGGKWKHLLKRQYPSSCELCGKKVKLLHYHHWDDEHPEMGIWLCPACHRFAEGFDKADTNKDIFNNYCMLKHDIIAKYYQMKLF